MYNLCNYYKYNFRTARKDHNVHPLNPRSHHPFSQGFQSILLQCSQSYSLSAYSVATTARNTATKLPMPLVTRPTAPFFVTWAGAEVVAEDEAAVVGEALAAELDALVMVVVETFEELAGVELLIAVLLATLVVVLTAVTVELATALVEVTVGVTDMVPRLASAAEKMLHRAIPADWATTRSAGLVHAETRHPATLAATAC